MAPFLRKGRGAVSLHRSWLLSNAFKVGWLQGAVLSVAAAALFYFPPKTVPAVCFPPPVSRFRAADQRALVERGRS